MARSAARPPVSIDGPASSAASAMVQPCQFGFFGWGEVEVHGAGELATRFSSRANTVWTGFRPFLFFRHPGPHSLFGTIDTDENFSGNRGAISSRKPFLSACLDLPETLWVGPIG